ncbi:MAG: proline--tRNA ligase [Gemmatimonadales bacterium]|nr:Proline--tRNA ligase [bacterium HR33]GIW50824.1 MAG: proline--tRNA ligase [Gemmatimonadales bacterium]
MAKEQTAEKGITSRAEDFAAWYNDVVLKAELADYSPVRGCMVIRPRGYRIWELMQRALDDLFKETGHENAYFPLFIPQSFLAREAEHVEGFSPQLAVVTHGGGKELEEPLVVRPTSETIIYAMLSKWIQSYRDLPVLLNQWANVVRWEMRTRLFLRTTEFLWQEGHTAHATAEEAEAEARTILGVYRRFMEEWMAMPVLTGQKTDAEKFAGAVRTYSCEALMQDNRALQAGTSHFLGQNFARAFGVQFQTAQGDMDYVWSTSWGVSTRLIGGLVMTHGDDVGLVCPPRLAPLQVVVVPIWKSDTDSGSVLEAARRVEDALRAGGIRVNVDDRESMTPGAKYYYWELRGVPVRLEVGPRDVAQGQVVLARRTGGKVPVPVASVLESVKAALEEIQAELLRAARERREANSLRHVNRDQLTEYMEAGGGFAYGGFCGSPECEVEIKERTKATIRVLPDPEFRSDPPPASCAWCGKKAVTEAVWARAY